MVRPLPPTEEKRDIIKRCDKMRSPIKWHGGKGMFVKHLLNYMPPHKHYVEVFGGGASFLFAKYPSGGVEVYNDIYSGVVNLFRVLRDPDKFQRFYNLVQLSPYSREDYNYYKNNWWKQEDEVEKARQFFVLARMCFSGDFYKGSWGFTVSYYLSSINQLPEIHHRLMRVQIEHNDFRSIIKTFDDSNTLLYVDPPYVRSTCSKDRYEHELTKDDHEDLVDLLIDYPGKVMLSAYNHGIYDRLLEQGWKKIEVEVSSYASGRTKGTKLIGEGAVKDEKSKTECIWLNKKAQEKDLTLFGR